MSALSSLKKYLKSKGQEINDEWYVKIETRKSGKSVGKYKLRRKKRKS